MIAVYQPSVSAATMQKAERLAEMVPSFPTARDKQTGITYVIVPSSDDPERTGHLTNGMSCTCLGWKRNDVCSHALAVTLHDQRQTAARIKAAQELRRQNGVCKQQPCIMTAARPGGRCADHNRVLCERLGI